MLNNAKGRIRSASRPQPHVEANVRIPFLRSRHFVTVLYALLGFLGGFSLVPYGVVAVSLAALAILDLLVALDDSPVVLEIAAAIAVLQQVLGPWFMYEFFNTHPLYRMWVPDSIYFPFAIGGTVLYLLALRIKLPLGASRFRISLQEEHTFTLGICLVVIGLIAGVLVRFGPLSLGFFFYLISNLRYIGAIYVYSSGNKYKLPVIALVIAGIYFTATSQGMFHELILWGSLGGSYLFVGQRKSFILKLAAVCVGVLAVIVIQVVKPVFRKQLNYDENASFAQTVSDLSLDDVFSRKSLESVTVRVSQGWLISTVMYTTPQNVPFGEGITFYEAFEAALIPRFIAPDKRVASSRENLHRYSFIRVNENTQMGLGSLGECWANFGLIGGILAMGGFGLVLNLVYSVMSRLSWYSSFFFFCLPILFLQPVKVETESLTVLNHLVKSGVVVMITYVGLRWAGFIAAPTSRRNEAIRTTENENL